ncbi:hypothetical protein E2320_013435 [Naja naja]|nr:hypothetical protein E2320_013435 [Naja naja]
MKATLNSPARKSRPASLASPKPLRPPVALRPSRYPLRKTRNAPCSPTRPGRGRRWRQIKAAPFQPLPPIREEPRSRKGAIGVSAPSIKLVAICRSDSKSRFVDSGDTKINLRKLLKLMESNSESI